MSLLRVHRLLIGSALAMSLVLLLWGVAHGVVRHEPRGWVALAIAALALPAGGLYLRKLYRNPPIRP